MGRGATAPLPPIPADGVSAKQGSHSSTLETLTPWFCISCSSSDSPKLHRAPPQPPAPPLLRSWLEGLRLGTSREGHFCWSQIPGAQPGLEQHTRRLTTLRPQVLALPWDLPWDPGLQGDLQGRERARPSAGVGQFLTAPSADQLALPSLRLREGCPTRRRRWHSRLGNHQSATTPAGPLDASCLGGHPLGSPRVAEGLGVHSKANPFGTHQAQSMAGPVVDMCTHTALPRRVSGQHLPSIGGQTQSEGLQQGFAEQLPLERPPGLLHLPPLCSLRRQEPGQEESPSGPLPERLTLPDPSLRRVDLWRAST